MAAIEISTIVSVASSFAVRLWLSEMVIDSASVGVRAAGAVTLILPELLSEPHSHAALQPDVAVRVTSEAIVAMPMPVTVKGSSNEPPGLVAIDLMSALSATASFSEAPTVTEVWAVVERLFLLSVTVSVTEIVSPSVIAGAVNSTDPE